MKNGLRFAAIHNADCFEWMSDREPCSIHAIVTDPPYGVKEYTEPEKSKLRRGRGGVWRIPPSFDGCKRAPLPRFTVLSDSEKVVLGKFFARFARCAMRVLVSGGHAFVASNPLMAHLAWLPFVEAGFEMRGDVVRLVQTLRGGDRPKNAHREFPGVTVMPRSCWEPWGLFRKPGAGSLRRRSEEGELFSDVVQSSPTRPEERAICPHPSLKPQALMRQLVRASLSTGRGVVLDPFMGGGSTIAAAEALGYESIGIELDPAYFAVAREAIPRLARLRVG